MIERRNWPDEAGDTSSSVHMINVEHRTAVPAVAARSTALEMHDVPPSVVADLDLDPDLVADWEEAGGLGHRFSVACRVAGQLVEALSAGDKAQFLSDFDALPEPAQSAIFLELALEPDGAVRPASEADVARFAATNEGAAIVKAWRRHAARNIAILRTRIERILSQAQAANTADALVQWFGDLTPEAATAIYRVLVR